MRRWPQGLPKPGPLRELQPRCLRILHPCQVTICCCEEDLSSVSTFSQISIGKLQILTSLPLTEIILGRPTYHRFVCISAPCPTILILLSDRACDLDLDMYNDLGFCFCCLFFHQLLDVFLDSIALLLFFVLFFPLFFLLLFSRTAQGLHCIGIFYYLSFFFCIFRPLALKIFILEGIN